MSSKTAGARKMIDIPATVAYKCTHTGQQQNGPRFDDQGMDAWHVESTGLARFQTGLLSKAQQDDALANGWTMSGTIRVTGAPDDRGLVTMNLESMGDRRYDINLGLDASGQTFVRLNEQILTNPLRGVGPTAVVPEAAPSYHEYELVFDPVSHRGRG